MKYWVYLSLSLLILSGCKDFFGKKTSTDFIEIPNYDAASVAYVPILPEIKTLKPVDICAGFDQLLYVADAGTQEIISLDQSGKILGRFFVKGLTAVTQDRSLDLLAIGSIDTVFSGTNFTIPAIYRINIQNGTYGLANAQVTKIIAHPFYLRSSFNARDAEVKFNKISILADNSYYVTRTGPQNISGNPYGPDDAVIMFDSQDRYVDFVRMSTDQGLLDNYFSKPFGITSLAKGPQSNSVSNSRDFIVSSADPFTSLKVQYISVSEGEDGLVYKLNTDMVTGDTSKADGFLYTVGKFSQPYGLSFTEDGTNYILVTDAEKDSVYLFTSTGLEGVKPPAGSTSTKNIKVSLGGTGSQPNQCRAPMAVAHLNKTLYVCDSENGRILRFKLTTDLSQ